MPRSGRKMRRLPTQKMPVRETRRLVSRTPLKTYPNLRDAAYNWMKA